MDGMQQALDNLEVSYTYHEHEGSEGSTANGCYTQAVYHSHLSTCYQAATGSLYWENHYRDDQGNWCNRYYCNTCGAFTGQQGVSNGSGFKSGQLEGIHQCGYTIAVCGKSTDTIESYTLGCGKTDETIESVTIIY